MSAPPRPSTTRTSGSRTSGARVSDARTSRPASRTTARRGRLVEESSAPEPGPLGLTHLVAGTLSAVQGLVLSLAVVVLPAVVAYLVGTAAQAPAAGAPDGDAQVRSAIDVAMGIWLLGHGVPLTAGAVTISLAPLGITALALFGTYVAAKRFATTSLRAWAAGTATYALCTTAVAALAGSAPGWSLALAPLGGALLGGLGMALGILARPDAPTAAEIGEGAETLALRLTRLDLVPATLRLGLRGGVLACALLVGGAALLVVAWALAGRATSSDIVTALEPGWTGGIVFAVAQLALLPNFVLWALAWLAGPGFAIGAGTSFTPFGTISGPLPAIPLLGALPGEDWANPVSAWAPVLVVACGVAAGLFAWRRLEPSLVRWSDAGWVLGGIVLAPGVLVLAGQWAAAGAGGPGRLSDVGANPLMTAGLVAAEVGGGALAVLLGAKLDVVARRGEIGSDLSAWLRRPAPGPLGAGRDDADRDGAGPDGAGPDGAGPDGAGPDGDAGRGPEVAVVDLPHDDGSRDDAPERPGAPEWSDRVEWSDDGGESDGSGRPDGSAASEGPGGPDRVAQPDRPNAGAGGSAPA